MKEIKKAGYVPIHHIMDLSGKKCNNFPSPEPHERPKANLSNVAFETLLVSKREFGYLVLYHKCISNNFVLYHATT